jgi:hypothetical protein
VQYVTLVEAISAVHLSPYVQSPFNARGGLFLVSPPGSFKTTITETLDEFPMTQVISDMNVQTLVRMKELFLSNHIRTLAFSDFGKLYKRHGSVADNMEGILMALADEGFRKASFQNQSSGALPARVTIVGGMTSAFFESKEKDWTDNGFLRRFMFAKYVVDNLEIIEKAANDWRRAMLEGDFAARIPSSRTIPYTIDEHESKMIEYIVRHQYSRIAATVMLRKMFSVWKWKFSKSNPKRAVELLKDFAPCLSKDGGTLVLKEATK